MKIGQNTFVSITYNLTSGGKAVESVTAERPLEFIWGAGFMLPKFEANLLNLTQGDKFAFSLEGEDAYGPVHPEAIVELPREIFRVDGAEEPGLLEVGNQLPMGDNQGNHMIGVVKAVTESTVTMDFNHPMAGKPLDFEGEVVGVREVTEEDIAKLNSMMGGGCGCGCGDEGCSSEDCSDKDCGCGCN